MLTLNTNHDTGKIGTMTVFITICNWVITQYKYNIKTKQVMKLVTLQTQIE